MSFMTSDGTADETARLFGRGVALHRTAAGLSQRELSDLLRARGLSFDTAAISRIENGNRSVRLSEAVTIAAALNAPLEALVNGGRESPATREERAREAEARLQAFDDATQSLIDAVTRFWTEQIGTASHADALQDEGVPFPRGEAAWIAAVGRDPALVAQDAAPPIPVFVPTDRSVAMYAAGARSGYRWAHLLDAGPYGVAARRLGVDASPPFKTTAERRHGQASNAAE